MKAFAAFDQVLNSNALSAGPAREIAPASTPGAFLPFAPGALATTKTEASAGSCEPQIELVQENGRIQQIVVTCRCGERTVMDCAY